MENNKTIKNTRNINQEIIIRVLNLFLKLHTNLNQCLFMCLIMEYYIYYAPFMAKWDIFNIAQSKLKNNNKTTKSHYKLQTTENYSLRNISIKIIH